MRAPTFQLSQRASRVCRHMGVFLGGGVQPRHGDRRYLGLSVGIIEEIGGCWTLL
jgi:hypothetical protein